MVALGATVSVVVRAVATAEITAVEVSLLVLPISLIAHQMIDYGDYSGGSGGFRDSSSRRNYEEYEAGDDDVLSARRSNSISARGSASSPAPRRSATTPVTPVTPAPPTKANAPEPIPDLLGLDDDAFSSPESIPTVPAAAPPLAAASATADCTSSYC